MRAFFSYGVALVILLLVAGWLASGTLINGGQGPGQGETAIVDIIEGDEGPLRRMLESVGLIATHEEEAAEAAAEALSVAEQQQAATVQAVRAVRYEARELPLEVPLRGRTRATAKIAARAETNGLVQAVMVRKGQEVAAGDLLCRLDQGTRQAAVAQAEAALAQAEAALAQAEADLETNQQLRERGLSPANTARSFEVAARSAQAQLRASQLTLDNARVELERTEIYAEVAGVIQDPLANVGDNLSAGGECATIVQLDPMLFVASVAEARIAEVGVGMPVRVRTVTGQTAEGEVRFVAATADAATRAFSVEVEMDNADRRLFDGVTAEAVVQIGTAEAHLLPQSALTLATDGAIGVQTVEGETARFLPVQILRDTTEGVWVAGLPETVSVITVGQEFVADGQQIAASYVTAAAADEV